MAVIRSVVTGLGVVSRAATTRRAIPRHSVAQHRAIKHGLAGHSAIRHSAAKRGTTGPNSLARRRHAKRGQAEGRLRSGLSALCALAAVSLLLYPLVANYLVGRQTSSIVSSYEGRVKQLSNSQTSDLLKGAEQYNRYIADSRFGRPWQGPVPDYESTLNIGPNSMMGYISIPQIGVANIPIYHGDSETVLSAGVGHVPQSSLPIGGRDSHAILPAHSGRVNNTLFTNLDKLEKGDVFYINSLGRQLKYRVFRVSVVSPDDLSTLSVVKGRDLVTLVTCYPTGVNSQRLLVSGERVPVSVKTPSESVQRNRYGYDFWVMLGSAVLALVAVLLLIRRAWLAQVRKRKETR